jgi:pantothenate kinase
MTAAPVLTPAAFADRLAALAADGRRRLVALAGAPGSGKSTVAADVAARLNAAAPGLCAVVPMDGFHYDDAVLVPRGWRPRKGAPHTFDVAGLSALLRRLRAGDEDVAHPLFDRKLELSRAAAAVAPRAARLILVEGNWLLLRDPPWDALGPLFDLTAMTDCPMDLIEARLRARWRDLPPAEAAARVEGNDLPNARRVLEGSAAPDLRVRAG